MTLQTLVPQESDWFKLPYGTVGVMSFFVVSGYIISEAAHTFYENKPLQFIVNRLVRILAPYYFALICASLAIALLFFSQKFGYVLNQDWSGGSYILTTCMPWNLIAPLDYRVVLGAEPCFVIVRYLWAVVVELQFYVVVALAILVGRFLGLRLAGLLIGAVIFALYLAYRFAGFQPLHVVTFSPYFLAGSLAFTVRECRYRLPVVALASSWVMYDFWEKVRHGTLPFQTTILMAVSMTVFVFLCWRSTPPWMKRADRFAGDLSYPVYLNHYAVEILFAALIGTSWLGLTLSIAIVLGLSIAASVVVEPRISALRSRLPGAAI